MPEPEVLSWAATLCDALTYLHNQTPPITFRDLKPQNVMLRPDGRVALIDFGIARAMVAPGGTAIGTGGYAPPEQYQGLAEARSDVYGLAATLHHLLTGRDPTRHPPFRFPLVRSLVPTLGAQVETVLLHALSIAPDDRFPTVSALATALRTVPTPAPLTARTSQRVTRHVQPVLQPISRLDALIAEARHTNTGLPHVLLVGPAPPGMLLRHIAEAIARDLGVTIRTVNSRDMAHVGDLATVLTSVQAGDIVSRRCREMWAADDGEAENEDRLLAEAGQVVREYRRASVSLLQRRLSIGYIRAARLLDQLEERGIVGPSADGRSRVVLDLEADPEWDAAWERATPAEAERDEAQTQVRTHAERRGWPARLLRG